MKWKLVWRDHTFTETDITGADLFAVDLVGGGWRACDPESGPIAAANLTAVLIARKTGRDFEEIVAEMAAAPAEEVVGILRPPS